MSTDGFKGEASAADLREVLVTLRASADAPNETELTLRGPVAWAHRLNAGVGGVVVGMCGVTGGGIGWAASGALAGALLGSAVVSIPVAAALAAAVTVGSAVGSSALALVGFRGLYGYSIGKGRQGLESLLSVVAVEAQGGWGLGSDAAPGLDDATKELEPGDRPAIGPGAAPDEDPT